VADHQRGAHYQERSLISGPYPTYISNNARKCNLDHQFFNIA